MIPLKNFLQLKTNAEIRIKKLDETGKFILLDVNELEISLYKVVGIYASDNKHYDEDFFNIYVEKIK